MLWGSVGAVEADQSIGGIWRRAVACGCKQALPRIRSIDRCPSDSPSDSPCHYGPSVPIPESDAHRVAGDTHSPFPSLFILITAPSSLTASTLPASYYTLRRRGSRRPFTTARD